MTQNSKQSVLNDNKINRQPFVQIRKLAENPLSPQKHYNIDSVNQIQNLPQVKEFLNKDVKKYFKYRDQQNANINSVKQEIDTINGSSTTDYRHPHQQIKRGDITYFSSSQSVSSNSEPQYISHQFNQKPQKQRIINGKNQKKELEEVILEDVDRDTQLRPRDMSEYLSQPRMKSAATNLMPIKIPSRQAGPFLTQTMSSFNSKQNTRTPIAINPVSNSIREQNQQLSAIQLDSLQNVRDLENERFYRIHDKHAQRSLLQPQSARLRNQSQNFIQSQNLRRMITSNQATLQNQMNMPLTARKDQQRRNPFSQSGLDFSSQNGASDGIENAQIDQNSNKVVIENERNLVKSSI